MFHDTLIRIKNSQISRRKVTKIPYSAMALAICEILAERGYVSSSERKGKGYKRYISIGLNQGERKIKGIKFLSRPSRHIYKGYKELMPVRRGYGLMLVSTSKGIMSGEEAKKQKVGGEVLFEIW